MTEEQTKHKRRRSRRGRRSDHVRELPEIFFCGDPHGGFDQINEAARLYAPDAMVILGDLQPEYPLQEILEEALHYTDIWWIPGNHDTDTDEIYDNLWRSDLRDHNLHGRSVNIHGVRIAGLGGVFRGQVWMPDGSPNYFSPSSFMRRIGSSNAWRGGIPRRHRSTIFPSVYQNLLHQKADILVTHEAPGCHRKGFCAIDELAKSLGAKWIFHGHQHEDLKYCEQEKEITPRAVGYRGVVNLKGEVVIAAQLDPREAAGLLAAFDWEDRMHHDAIIVRDEMGVIQVVENQEGLVPAILPATIVPPCHGTAEQLDEEMAQQRRARRLGQEVARKAPGGRYRPTRPWRESKKESQHAPRESIVAKVLSERLAAQAEQAKTANQPESKEMVRRYDKPRTYRERTGEDRHNKRDSHRVRHEGHTSSGTARSGHSNHSEHRSDEASKTHRTPRNARRRDRGHRASSHTKPSE
ncbi:MAG: metallophosphoesterase [Sutterella sp.]|nr:metallophosphoesterase [Sutterella sp.]